jgi:crotonobetainyl-CoA:carnitine CoA-transferase CaiB-like acyl-CoA transferase
MVTPMEHSVTGPQIVVSPLVAMSVTPTAAQRPSPPLGAHSREVLLECGLGEEEVAALVENGVVSSAD